jgi:hypothetical protein
MDVLLSEYPAVKPALKEMLLSLDIYYDIYDAQPGLADICFSLYIPNQEEVASRNVAVVNACVEYAQSKTRITDVLTAGDILKIDRAIKSSDIKPLTVDQGSDYVEIVWAVLHELYEPQRQYPMLLESAIACYRLLTLSDSYQFHLLSLAVLLSTIYQNHLAFRGFTRQWILSTDPKLAVASMDLEDALLHILDVFRDMWKYTATLIHKLNSEKEKLPELISLDCPQQVSMGFCKILSQ